MKYHFFIFGVFFSSLGLADSSCPLSSPEALRTQVNGAQKQYDTLLLSSSFAAAPMSTTEITPGAAPLSLDPSMVPQQNKSLLNLRDQLSGELQAFQESAPEAHFLELAVAEKDFQEKSSAVKNLVQIQESTYQFYQTVTQLSSQATIAAPSRHLSDKLQGLKDSSEDLLKLTQEIVAHYQCLHPEDATLSKAKSTHSFLPRGIPLGGVSSTSIGANTRGTPNTSYVLASSLTGGGSAEEPTAQPAKLEVTTP